MVKKTHAFSRIKKRNVDNVEFLLFSLIFKHLIILYDYIITFEYVTAI